MTGDPIVKAVRKIRHEIEGECQHDPEKYYLHLKASQEKFAGRTICRQPKPLVPDEKRKTG